MTSLDLLLSLARVTAVGILAILAGYWLLRRRPDVVPGLALAGLFSGCVLVAAAGSEWPTVWESSLSATLPAANADSGGPNSSSETKASSNLGVSLSDVDRFLRELDVADAGAASPTGLNLVAVLSVLVALAFVRILFGIVSTVRFHKRSNIVNSDRLQVVLSTFDEKAEAVDELEFRVSEQIHAPCVTAISQRCIYLPMNWDDYSDDELTAAIVHELGHLNRRDARWRLLAQLATAFQVFHPLSHGLLRQLVIGQELSADRWAAEAIGHSRFVRGISQLALRLDHAALPRRSQGIGMSHSSSFLIRRIKMLRYGMPAHRGKTHWLTRKFATLAIVAAAVVTASWSLSAEEPVRVATRITDPLTDKHPERETELWNILPGRTGYWTLNVEAALKHQVIGAWLSQADATFLTAGWMMIANDDAKGRRSELGLVIPNISRLSGSVKMETKFIHEEDNDHNFHSSVTSGEFVMRMRRDVDWSLVAAALPEDRLDAGIRSLVGPDFPEEGAEEIIEQNIFADFFAKQTDPRRFILKQETDEEPAATAPIIKSLWKDFGGEIATMVVQLPSMSGKTETRLQKLMQTLHETAEYEVVGVDHSTKPGKVRLRMGLTPRKGTTAKELLATMSAIIQATVEEEKEDADETEKEILRFLEIVKPEIRKSFDPTQPSAVMVEGDLNPSALWIAVGA